MENLYLNTIRIIKKSGKYTFGDGLIDKIRGNRVSLVVIANDMGESMKKKVKDKCNSFHVDFIELLDKATLSSLFNKSISCFGILDENLAKKLLENVNKS